jgi:hypothetical protein
LKSQKGGARDMISPSCWGQKLTMTERFVMTGKTQESSAARRLFAGSALTLAMAFSPVSSQAAEDFFQFNPPFALPAPLFGGETHIPAARPLVANPARARYAVSRGERAAPEGRLRLRPMAFGRM